MKKFIIILASIIIAGISAHAQVYTPDEQYQAIYVSTADWSETTKDYVWSDWSKSEKVPVVFNPGQRYIKIYSVEQQSYSILNQLNEGDDGKGYFKDYAALDQEGLRCIIKTRVQKEDSIMQVCIYYDNVAWAYCIVEREL